MIPKDRLRLVFVLTLAFSLLAIATWAAEPPATVAYQGALRDAMGNPINGDVDIVFRFFDALSAGNEALVDEHVAAGTGAVAVSGGVLNVVLGSGSVSDGTGPGSFASLRDVFADLDSVYLEVQVNTETLTPRTQIHSTGFALNADSVDGVDSLGLVDRSNHTGTQTPLTISPQGAGSTLDSDTIDGIEVGSSTGEIPVNNAVLNTNLNADLLDGLEANELLAGTGGGSCGVVAFYSQMLGSTCVQTFQTFDCPPGLTLIGAIPVDTATTPTAFGFDPDNTTFTATSVTTTCCSFPTSGGTVCGTANRFEGVELTCCQ